MGVEKAFSIRELSFRYERRPVIRCASLDIALGETVAFAGANGSGKTTMMKLMNGLIGPFGGRIDFLGKPLARNQLLRSRSTYVHQYPVLFAGTVRENLRYALKLKKIAGEAAERRIDDTAARFNLQSLLDRRASRLSGGETQRVAVARAVAAGADILLLDEPTSSMDARGEADARSLLAELKRDGVTLVFSTHDRTLIDELADRSVLFDNREREGGVIVV